MSQSLSILRLYISSRHHHSTRVQRSCKLPTDHGVSPTSPRFLSLTRSSLSPECTPLKKRYDACFNLWFEGYLRPALDGQARLAPSSSSPSSSSTYTPSGSSSSSSSSTPSSSTGEPTSSGSTAVEPSRRLVTSWGRAFDRKTPKEVSVLPPGQAFLSFNDPDPDTESGGSFAAGESDLAGRGYTAGGAGGHAPHAGVPRVDPTGKTRAQVKAEEYELACGAAWKSYQKCLKVSNGQPAAGQNGKCQEG